MTNDRSLVEKLPGTRILVVGDVMLDEYIWGEARRISPEAPVVVVDIQRRTHVPGGAANAAAGAVALGGGALVAGVVGGDEHGRLLRQTVEAAGISANGCLVDDSRPTTTKTRVVANGQQVVRADIEVREPLAPDLEERLFEWIARHVDQVDALVLSDYGKGVISPRLSQRYIALGRGSRKPIVVDPKGSDFTKYSGATVVTPNVHEAERAANMEIQHPDDLARVAERLRAVLDATALLVTRGADGMSLFADTAAPVDIPADAHNVFDVTGAGDAVVATLALALGGGAALEDAARLANKVAGIVVGKVGTATATLEELRQVPLPTVTDAAGPGERRASIDRARK